MEEHHVPETEAAAATDPGALPLNPPKDPKFYGELTPADRVSYHQAKLALQQACTAYETAIVSAKRDQQKAAKDHQAAKKAWEDARDAMAVLVTQTKAKLEAIANATKNWSAENLADPKKPNAAKDQMKALQEAVDGYKACAAALSTQKQALSDAAAALEKLSNPPADDGEFDPAAATPSTAAQAVADQQLELAKAQARIPLDSAWDAFELKITELQGHTNKKRQ
jgi:hypothetical protein